MDRITSKVLCCADNDITTAEDFSDKGGYAVKMEPTGFGSLSVAATDRPFGIIETAIETTAADITADNFRLATVVIHGNCTAIAGAEIIPDVDNDTMVMVHTDGTVIPLAVPADHVTAAHVWSVGFLNPDESRTVSAGEQVRIFVNPQLFSNRYAPA